MYVTWEDARTYCSWVQRRLPTEAEWEMAASQWNEVKQQNYRYPWGEPIDCNYANYFQTAKTACEGDTNVVGSYPLGASLYGAMDMAGNVWEWVEDRYGLGYYNDSPASNPPGPEEGKERVFRGGAWNSGAYDLRSANRGYARPDTPRDDLGFRCAQDATP
jgi:formylglycine-generating enzyme required for sulfatase activity